MEQYVLELGSMIAENVCVMICGVFNVRTGSQNSVLDTEEWPRTSTDGYFLNKSSHNSVENTSGNQLIASCNVLDCSILNGADSFQFDDAMTVISTTGKSVIDYFVVPNCLVILVF